MLDINKLNCFHIDLKEVLARKSARLLWGQGFLLQSEDESINKFLKNWQEMSKAYNIFYAMEKVLSKWGRAILTIDKTEGGKYFLTIVNPQFTSKVGRVFVGETSAVIYKRVAFDDRMFIIKEVWDTKQVHRVVFNEGQDGKTSELTVQGFNASVPKDFQIREKWVHNLGVLPVIEFHNLPDQNFDFLYQGYNPDDRAVAPLNDYVDNSIIQMTKELVLNRTRVLGNISPEKLQQIQYGTQTDVRQLIEDFILETNLRKADGTPQVEIIQGDPKLETYWLNITKGIQMYFNMSGYEWSSEDSEATPETATGVMVGKGRDIETTEEKRFQRTKDIYRLLDRLLMAEGLMEKDGDRQYSFEIRRNIVVNEEKQTDTLIKQYEAGAISRDKMISTFNGGMGDDEVQELRKKIDQDWADEAERQQALNPQEDTEKVDTTDSKTDKEK